MKHISTTTYTVKHELAIDLILNEMYKNLKLSAFPAADQRVRDNVRKDVISWSANKQYRWLKKNGFNWNEKDNVWE